MSSLCTNQRPPLRLGEAAAWPPRLSEAEWNLEVVLWRPAQKFVDILFLTAVELQADRVGGAKVLELRPPRS